MGRSSGCLIRFMVKWVQDVIDEEGRYGNDNYAFGSMRKGIRLLPGSIRSPWRWFGKE